MAELIPLWVVKPAQGTGSWFEWEWWMGRTRNREAYCEVPARFWNCHSVLQEL